MIYPKKIVDLLILPSLILVISFTVLSLSVHVRDIRFLSTISQLDTSNISENSKKITGIIPSTQGKVGTIIVSFQEPVAQKGAILFTLRKIKTNEVVYQNKYSILDIYYLQNFPFGFPPQSFNNDTQYEFAITSEVPDEEIPVTLVKSQHPVEVLYQYDFNTLMTNAIVRKDFISNKINQYVTEFIKFGYIFFFFAPLLVYYYTYIFRKEVITSAKQTLLPSLLKPSVLFMIFIMLSSGIIVLSLSDVFLIKGMIIWIILVTTYRYTNQQSFFIALLFLLLCPLAIISDMSEIASNLASWAFMLIFVGTIQEILDFRKILTGLHFNFTYVTRMDIKITKNLNKLYQSISQ